MSQDISQLQKLLEKLPENPIRPLYLDYDVAATDQTWAQLAAFLAGFVFTAFMIVLPRLQEEKARQSISTALAALLVCFFLFIVAMDLCSMSAGDKLPVRQIILSGLGNIAINAGILLMFLCLAWITRVYDQTGSLDSLTTWLFFIALIYTGIMSLHSQADIVEAVRNFEQKTYAGGPPNYSYSVHRDTTYWLTSLFMILPTVFALVAWKKEWTALSSKTRGLYLFFGLPIAALILGVYFLVILYRVNWVCVAGTKGVPRIVANIDDLHWYYGYNILPNILHLAMGFLFAFCILNLPERRKINADRTRESTVGTKSKGSSDTPTDAAPALSSELKSPVAGPPD